MQTHTYVYKRTDGVAPCVQLAVHKDITRIHTHTYVYTRIHTYTNTQVEPLHDIQLAVYKDIEELARIVCSGDFLGRQQVYVCIRMHTYAYVYVRMHMHTVLETS